MLVELPCSRTDDRLARAAPGTSSEPRLLQDDVIFSKAMSLKIHHCCALRPLGPAKCCLGAVSRRFAQQWTSSLRIVNHCSFGPCRMNMDGRSRFTK